MKEEGSFNKLDLASTISFQGKLLSGLSFHRDDHHIAYGAGNTVIVKDLENGKETRFNGHSHKVTCVTISRDGTFLASGQEKLETRTGSKVEVIIWNFHENKIYGLHNNHFKGRQVEAVSFTCDSKFVISLGGKDCGNVVVYDIDGLATLCSTPAATLSGGISHILRCVHTRNDVFLSAGDTSIRVWKIDFKAKKAFPANAVIGRLKRNIRCLDVDHTDSYIYCGTSIGDVLKLKLIMDDYFETREYDAKLICCLTRLIKAEIVADIPLYRGGVTSIAILKTGDLLIGTGEGQICKATEYDYLQKNSTKKLSSKSSGEKMNTELKLRELEKTLVEGEVTSITIKRDGQQFLVGSTKSEIYQVILNGLHCERIYTCHRFIVNDVIFPHKCSDLFATCSVGTIRTWNLGSSQELIRIEVPKMVCNTIFLMQDGRSIISGWNDGKIRAYTPETGHLLYTIENAHLNRVTAITAASNSARIISGGGDGEIRIWSITPIVQVLVNTMKEHKGKITCIRMKKNDKECVSSGGDGFCIIWNLQHFVRLQVIFNNTLLQAVCYGFDEEQIICAGNDGKVYVHEVVDGSPLKALQASLSGAAINAMDITNDFKVFVTGGEDRLIKVWKYLDGVVTHVGEGHSDVITTVRISPDKKHIISAARDGCIIRWKFPEELL